MIALVIGSTINIMFVTLLVSIIAFLVLILFYYISFVVDSWDLKNSNGEVRKVDLLTVLS